jgi:hypothetical protein
LVDSQSNQIRYGYGYDKPERGLIPFGAWLTSLIEEADLIGPYFIDIAAVVTRAVAGLDSKDLFPHSL